ncbi:MAG: DNA alkylation repair protein [Bacteroidota bacterium]
MTPEILNRKGPRKAEDIPSDVLELLNTGKIETVNLTEWLAINQVQLIEATFPELGVSNDGIDLIRDAIHQQKKPTTVNTVKLVGSILFERAAEQDQINPMISQFSEHPSDTIRSYAPFLIGLNPNLSIDEKLEQAQPIAADSHFGVREIVWMALRPSIDQHLDRAITILADWTQHPDENVRRFATESTRPRGVWCKHIERLKEEPELALPLLNPLKNDPAKYVQDSVGNWLNDASKTRADFVIQLCQTWETESPTKITKRIIKKARRTIDKA